MSPDSPLITFCSLVPVLVAGSCRLIVTKVAMGKWAVFLQSVITGTKLKSPTRYSVGAPASGTSDRLRSTLVSVPDWRDAQSGAYTRWFCSDIEELSIAVSIFEGERGKTATNIQLV